MYDRGMTEYPPILKPSEVCDMFGVTRQTLARWRKSGKLTCVYTPGGHPRYVTADVLAYLTAPGDPQPRD